MSEAFWIPADASFAPIDWCGFGGTEFGLGKFLSNILAHLNY
jgi:hypothetical protein